MKQMVYTTVNSAQVEFAYKMNNRLSLKSFISPFSLLSTCFLPHISPIFSKYIFFLQSQWIWLRQSWLYVFLPVWTVYNSNQVSEIRLIKIVTKKFFCVHVWKRLKFWRQWPSQAARCDTTITEMTSPQQICSTCPICVRPRNKGC